MSYVDEGPIAGLSWRVPVARACDLRNIVDAEPGEARVAQDVDCVFVYDGNGAWIPLLSRGVEPTGDLRPQYTNAIDRLAAVLEDS